MVTNFKKIRERYKPAIIKVLFIAEAPPTGDTYFYLHNSNLYRAVRKAFEQVFGIFPDDLAFLEFFKNSGCYLDDLCLQCVNKLPKDERKKERQHGIISLSKRIEKTKPEAIIIVMKAIEEEVARAISLSGITSLSFVTPFPVQSEANVQNCIKEISRALKVLFINT